MLKDVLDELGTVKVARACGVTPACVAIWKRKGYLPRTPGKVSRRARRYEVLIADLAGITTDELRERIEAGKKAA